MIHCSVRNTGLGPENTGLTEHGSPKGQEGPLMTIEPKNAPGPWKVKCGHNGVIYIEDPDGSIVATVGRGPEPEQIGGQERAERNARLIASAPALLAALKECLNALETHLRDDAKFLGTKPETLCPCMENEVSRGKAAIALAEGKE